MQFHSLIVSALFVLLCLVVWTNANTLTCDDSSPCLYGFCDQGHCRCSLDCNSFEAPQLVCKNGHVQTECGALNNACQEQKMVPTRGVSTAILTSVNFYCSAVKEEEFSEEIEFCQDQQYCNKNGICKKDFLGNSYCRCNDLFEGERCNIRKSIKVQVQPSVSKPPQISATPTNSPSGNRGSSMFGPPVISSIAGVLSCMMCACFIITYQKRNKRQPLKKTKRCLQDSHDDIITNNKTIPRKNQKINYTPTEFSMWQNRKIITTPEPCNRKDDIVVSLPAVETALLPNMASADGLHSIDRSVPPMV